VELEREKMYFSLMKDKKNLKVKNNKLPKPDKTITAELRSSRPKKEK